MLVSWGLTFSASHRFLPPPSQIDRQVFEWELGIRRNSQGSTFLYNFRASHHHTDTLQLPASGIHAKHPTSQETSQVVKHHPIGPCFQKLRIYLRLCSHAPGCDALSYSETLFTIFRLKSQYVLLKQAARSGGIQAQRWIWVPANMLHGDSFQWTRL